MHGLARVPVPKDGRLPLVGDADSQTIGRRNPGARDRVANRIAYAFPDLIEVVLDPAWTGKMLRKFVVRAPQNLPGRR